MLDELASTLVNEDGPVDVPGILQPVLGVALVLSLVLGCIAAAPVALTSAYWSDLQRSFFRRTPIVAGFSEHTAEGG